MDAHERAGFQVPNSHTRTDHYEALHRDSEPDLLTDGVSEEGEDHQYLQPIILKRR